LKESNGAKDYKNSVFGIILLSDVEFLNLVLNYPDIYQRKLQPLEIVQFMGLTPGIWI